MRINLRNQHKKKHLKVTREKYRKKILKATKRQKLVACKGIQSDWQLTSHKQQQISGGKIREFRIPYPGKSSFIWQNRYRHIKKIVIDLC